MKTHRLFFAINLPDKIKDELLIYQEKYSSLPVNWTPQENLHLTLVFLGDTASNRIQKINTVAEAAQEDATEFSCELKKVVLAPPGSEPRMFWVRVKKNNSLLRFQQRLEEELVQSSQTGYQRSSERDYLPHITLGRINQDEWKRLKDRPRVTESLELSFRAETFELMESTLKPSGAEYRVRDSFSLK